MRVRPKVRMRMPLNLFAAPRRNDDPHVDGGASWFPLIWQAFDGLDAIDPVVCGLRCTLPWSQAEDAIHRVKRAVRSCAPESHEARRHRQAAHPTAKRGRACTQGLRHAAWRNAVKE